ncbi:thioredoxin family protein [Octadecabacter sp. 1_MG-2023]|uniref:thioredoxin family protein n=1 Tax=unclassified Octadecabacter TaxID=196158 RepID=UPI001C08E658|nr:MULTISPECIES: thioredoxin family protein [unclassified Octadecabacter]MBU2992214.1 thioredoxin family protein [Octadecabacter sp. B2R22]MDO6735030.1 thioredoxin family protein [Octadecabacter sp. 1_MG-2023]
MKRRDFLVAAGATTLIPFAAQAAGLPYTEGLVQERLAAGETVFLDFKASWCTTCRAQERVINSIKADNGAYDDAITFIDVDWDEFGRSQLVNDLNIPRRSTLVVLKGEAELGRIVAGTRPADIQELMDVALNAATA